MAEINGCSVADEQHEVTARLVSGSIALGGTGGGSEPPVASSCVARPAAQRMGVVSAHESRTAVPTSFRCQGVVCRGSSAIITCASHQSWTTLSETLAQRGRNVEFNQRQSADRRQFPSLLHAVTMSMALMCVCGCQETGRNDRAVSAKPVPRELYCLLGTLSIEECFAGQSGVLVVRRPLEVSDSLASEFSREFSSAEGKSTLEILILFSEARTSPFTWGKDCQFVDVIGEIDDGADDSGIFPRTEAPSLRIQLSVPVLVDDDVAIVVANCTDCQKYFATNVIVLEYREGWRVRRSDMIGFA